MDRTLEEAGVKLLLTPYVPKPVAPLVRDYAAAWPTRRPGADRSWAVCCPESRAGMDRQGSVEGTLRMPSYVVKSYDYQLGT